MNAPLMRLDTSADPAVHVLIDRLLGLYGENLKLRAELDSASIEGSAEFTAMDAAIRGSFAEGIPPGCEKDAEIEFLKGDLNRARRELAEQQAAAISLGDLMAEGAATIVALRKEVETLKAELAAAVSAQDQLVWQAESVAMTLEPDAGQVLAGKLEIADDFITGMVSVPPASRRDAAPEASPPPSPEPAAEGTAETQPGGGAVDTEAKPEAGPPSEQGGIRPVIWTDPAYIDVLRAGYEAGRHVDDIRDEINALFPPEKTPLTSGQVAAKANNMKIRRLQGSHQRPQAVALGMAGALKTPSPNPKRREKVADLLSRVSEAPGTAVAVTDQPPQAKPLSPLAERWGGRVMELTDQFLNPDEIAAEINATPGLSRNDQVNGAMVRKIAVEMRNQGRWS